MINLGLASTRDSKFLFNFSMMYWKDKQEKVHFVKHSGIGVVLCFKYRSVLDSSIIIFQYSAACALFFTNTLIFIRDNFFPFKFVSNNMSHESILIDNLQLNAISFDSPFFFYIFANLIFSHCSNHLQLTRSCK